MPMQLEARESIPTRSTRPPQTRREPLLLRNLKSKSTRHAIKHLSHCLRKRIRHRYHRHHHHPLLLFNLQLVVVQTRHLRPTVFHPPEKVMSRTSLPTKMILNVLERITKGRVILSILRHPPNDHVCLYLALLTICLFVPLLFLLSQPHLLVHMGRRSLQSK